MGEVKHNDIEICLLNEKQQEKAQSVNCTRDKSKFIHPLCPEEKTNEERKRGRGHRFIHLMPYCGLAWLLFEAQSAGPSRRADKEQTGLSAGRSLCHHHSQATAQSHQLPGHLVSLLPAALTWQEVGGGTSHWLRLVATARLQPLPSTQMQTHRLCGTVQQRPNDKYSAIKHTCPTEGSRPSIHKPFHGRLPRLLKTVFSDALNNKSCSSSVEMAGGEGMRHAFLLSWFRSFSIHV